MNKVFVLATFLIVPNIGMAQQNVPPPIQNAAADAESTAKRFGAGVQGGIGLDPEIIDFGAHATFGPIFRPTLQVRPGVEFGLGELTTLFGINVDVLYTIPGFSGEKQLTKALPKLATASSNPKLRQAFESHLQETQGQIARLEKVFASLDEKVRGKHCDGIAGIIEEGKSIME